MITLPTDLANEIKNRYNRQVLLLNINDEYFFANGNENYYINGQTYLALAFEISDIDIPVNLGKSELTIKIDNVSLLPVSIFLNQEMRGKELVINYMICKDNYESDYFTFEVFRGFINSVSIENEIAEIRALQQLAKWDKDTLREYSYVNFPHLKDIELKPIKWGRE